MKKKYILLTAFIGVMLSACSDFLDRKPLTEPNNEEYLCSRAQVENYINGLYMALPAPSQYGMGVRGEEKNSDNILAEKYDLRLNGEYNAFSGSSEWQKGYQNLRNVNYFFYYYCVPENEETEDVLSLKGEAYFLRAYWHFYLLTRFGDIPLMDRLWDENATVAGLQIPPASRSDVAKFILEDLKTASEGMLQSRSKYSGLRISKEAAMILAMRVALYEGSWEKYHKGTEFSETDNSDYFFKEVMKWGDELFKAGLSLNTDATDNEAVNPGDAFAHLFNKDDLSKITEAVFWKKYAGDGVFHGLGGLLGGGVVDNDGPAGVSKSLVDNYLNADGTFINPNDEKYKDFNATFEKRDPRLIQSVMNTGAKFRSTAKGSKPMNVRAYDNTGTDEEIKEKNKDISSPNLNGDGNGKNITGFHIRLGIDTTFVEGGSHMAIILFRHSEALLAYAEAAEELNLCNDDVLNKTLKPLRERAGVTYIRPTQIDPNFTSFGYSLTPVMQEIRRERRAELAFQGFRQDDLMRWAGHKLIKGQRGLGAYLGTDGVLYKSFSPKAQESLGLVSTNDSGWMDPLKDYLPQGYQFQPDRDYLLPIPPDELELNKQLKQNPGWTKTK